MTVYLNDIEAAAARGFGLRPLEARAFVALRDCAENYCPRDRIHSDRNTCKALISILRSKLRPLGVKIRNVRGRGYFIEKSPGQRA